MLIVSCKKPGNPLPTASQKPVGLQRLVETLKSHRETASKASGVDPSVVPQFDHILEMIAQRGPESVRDAPQIIVAFAADDDTVPGATVLELTAVGPNATIQRVEVLDENKRVLATATRFQSGPGWKDDTSPLMEFGVAAYVMPMIKPTMPLDAARAKAMEGLHGEAFDLIQLPDRWSERPIFVRIVFSDGQVSEAHQILITSFGKIKQNRPASRDNESIICGDSW